MQVHLCVRYFMFIDLQNWCRPNILVVLRFSHFALIFYITRVNTDVKKYFTEPTA